MSVENLSLEEIQGYKETTLTILHKQIGILHQLDGILQKEEVDSKNKSDGILTVEKSNNFKAVLQNEITKLENFDVVLAVVGTMKAGKSTTINAIVGREILPNRNRPMTALPTLICHTPNQTIPTISLQPEAINEFLGKVKANLHLVEKSDGMHEDMQNLIEFISNGGQFQSFYEGEEKIFEFLYQLNDLVRLTTLIALSQDKNKTEKLTFPFDQYKNFENLPRINVEFNLEQDFNTAGRFMLLDTAGPNEAGQEALEIALKEQLARSSAVMIVLDYTQLNSDAEQKIKEEIDNIPSVQKSRLFALVNKFDQKNSNADEADATRNHIYHNLLKDKVELENIYAISAQDSYLANRMLTHINIHNELPTYAPKTWVEDFAKKVYGEMAEDVYPTAKVEMVKKGLDKILTRSRMQQPMQNVIGNMQKNAPIIAMQSALAGASQVFASLNNALDIRDFFAQKEDLTAQEISRIEDVIARLEAQSKDLENKKSELASKFDDIKKNINKRIDLDSKIKIINLQTKDAINDMFNAESTSAQKDLVEKEELFDRTKFSWFRLKTEKRVAREYAELDRLRDRARSDGNNLIFSSEQDLINFQTQASKTVEKFMNDNLTKAFDMILDDCIAEMKGVTKELNAESEFLLKELKNDFSKEGINLMLEFDGIGNLSKQTAKIGSIKLKSKKDTYATVRHEDGVMAKFKRGIGGLVGQDWGTYKVDYSTFTISKQETIEQFSNIIATEFIEPLKNQVEDKIQILFTTSTDYIDKFGKQVAEIINEMKYGIENENKLANLSKQEVEKYKELISETEKAHNELKPDWEKIASIFKVEEIKIPIENPNSSTN